MRAHYRTRVKILYKMTKTMHPKTRNLTPSLNLKPLLWQLRPTPVQKISKKKER
ncbi:hypothetical protein BofuT4_uP038010.1 [Botrytis cinerea T4]|uniref:Uncharacterized protein n=1 Tax=Botryotinia fuckeliana (strain T4) TaxID=999810 RepID=G2Y581_BOTF4|nr:hypothetical protein BofuT4_uP038010.1 [Botrytis cinerea T4]